MKKSPWYTARLWSGMDFFAWLRLLARNRFAVAPSRWPAALSITFISAVGLALQTVQRLRFGRRIDAAEVPDDPVFIVGHWRTGTKMLHELLSLDPRLRCPRTYESLTPNHFLVSEWFVRKFLWFVLPRERPMDNMRVSFDRPQEDEVALCNMGSHSPFLTVVFPNRPPQDPRYVDLTELSPAELARWDATLRQFLKRLLVRRAGRPVLKSPQHSFRLKHLGAAFPRAEFLHLVRDPYAVFLSTAHFWTAMYAEHGLQRPRLEGLNDYVFDTMTAMYRRLEAARESIAPERFWHGRYEDLVRDPLATVRGIYDHFGWPGFAEVRPAIERYAARAKRYEANRYDRLAPDLRADIARRWKWYFEKYGYEV